MSSVSDLGYECMYVCMYDGAYLTVYRGFHAARNNKFRYLFVVLIDGYLLAVCIPGSTLSKTNGEVIWQLNLSVVRVIYYRYMQVDKHIQNIENKF